MSLIISFRSGLLSRAGYDGMQTLLRPVDMDPKISTIMYEIGIIRIVKGTQKIMYFCKIHTMPCRVYLYLSQGREDYKLQTWFSPLDFKMFHRAWTLEKLEKWKER